MPKLEEKIQPAPNPLIHQLDGFLGMELFCPIRRSVCSTVTQINVPLTLAHLTKEQVAELGLQRDALQSIALVQEPARHKIKESCERVIAFTDVYPDRAYFYGRSLLAQPNINLDEKLDWIAAEVRNPHFSDEIAEKFERATRDIASELLAQDFKSMLQIKLSDAGPLPRLNEAKSKAVFTKILEDYTVSRAFEAIKKELPNINTRYAPSRSGTQQENCDILKLILGFLESSGFYCIAEIDPAKFRTFLETRNEDIFTQAFARIRDHRNLRSTP